MKRLSLVLPIVFTGCIYINQGVGVTTYEYDKCQEYYDASGVYHRDCPKSVFQKAGDFAKDSFIMIKESIKTLAGGKVQKTKKRCFCSKSCLKSCKQTKQECLKKCCHEK